MGVEFIVCQQSCKKKKKDHLKKKQMGMSTFGSNTSLNIDTHVQSAVLSENSQI